MREERTQQELEDYNDQCRHDEHIRDKEFDDAIQALKNLGYSADDVCKAMEWLDSQDAIALPTGPTP